MKYLLFTGAGASVELGIPTMKPLVNRFRDHLYEQDVDDQIIDIIDDLLDNPEFDMEHLVEDLDKIDQGHDALDRWGEGIRNPLKHHISVVRSEAEWFIQYVCERIQKEAAITLWRSTLRESDGHDLVIATTNYDRAIEITASNLNIDIADGFPYFGQKEWVSWSGYGSSTCPQLLKLHGSTDWYLSKQDDNVWKLRHPMPIWGEITLNLSGHQELQLESAAVLPSREKKVRHPPYPELNSTFREHALDSDFAIFLGTSLRDPEIRDVFRNCVNRCPTFLVNPNPEIDVDVSKEDVNIIHQTASMFLISTLPTSLQNDPNDTISKLRNHVGGTKNKEILNEISVVHNSNLDRDQRLEAIDVLTESRVALVKDDIMPILDSDDPEVRKYGLALIQESEHMHDLLDYVEKKTESDPDSELSKELEILKELTGRVSK